LRDGVEESLAVTLGEDAIIENHDNAFIRFQPN
jgi:hypothetical protein